MSDSVLLVVLAPHVPVAGIERLAIELRDRALPPRVFSFGTLENVGVRNPRTKRLRDLGVRVLLPDEPFRDLGPLETALGPGNFLYRHDDTDTINVLFPDPDWMQRTFKTREAEWLLHPMDTTVVPWRTETYYAVPGNPPSWGVKAPFFAALLGRVWSAGMDWECPLCGVHFSPRRSTFQCRNHDCNFGIRLFTTLDEAFTILRVPLGSANWGRCPRCQQGRTFAFEMEQCFRCGQLMHAVPGRNSTRPLLANLPDATALINDFRAVREARAHPASAG